MERFLKRKSSTEAGTSFGVSNSIPVTVKAAASASKKFVDLNSLPSDPALRKKICDYHPNQVDDIRRYYIAKGPCQPRSHDFPQKIVGNKLRRFNREWFDEYKNWLEYSITEDKAYCLCCYLFRDDIKGLTAFTSEGFSCWHKKRSLDKHVGEVNSKHDVAKKKLLGNFIETLKMIAKQNESINKVVLENSRSEKCQMIAPTIQKDIVECFSKEIVEKIIEELNGDFFSLLVDESSDISEKEQMAMFLRFVDSCGNVKERFLCIVHVKNTCAVSLKAAIEGVFADWSLSLMKLRGQGYDGASNMRGEFGGLKALIMKENPFAYYVHCFAHQLQLALVAVAKKHDEVNDFFNMISTLMNVVGASCKRKDMIREKQAEKVAEAIDNGLIETGTGLNQEVSLQRAADTRWGSHYRSLLSLTSLFSSVLEVLVVVSCDASDPSKRAQARGLLKYLRSFNFVFNLQLMLTILAITNELSLALQRKDTDILNAMNLVKVSREILQNTRNDGWESLHDKVIDFCNKNEIACLDMNNEYVDDHNSRRRTHVTNDFHYRVECFYVVMDQQILEINDRFNEVNSELLTCIASLSPSDGFVDFDKSKLIKLAHSYPDDFFDIDFLSLEAQLQTYIMDVRSDDRFTGLKGLGDLCSKLVTTKKYFSYPLLYRLLKFALILPVSTASVERCFSGMNIVKTHLRNRTGFLVLFLCIIRKGIFLLRLVVPRNIHQTRLSKVAGILLSEKRSSSVGCPLNKAMLPSVAILVLFQDLI
ncbi:hypothetical protein OROMI_005967 [Orobanche minor]